MVTNLHPPPIKTFSLFVLVIDKGARNNYEFCFLSVIDAMHEFFYVEYNLTGILELLTIKV